MATKKILVENSERDIVAEAIANSENEKLDILNFVMGSLQTVVVCNEPPDYRAYADGTYVKKAEG